MRYASTRYGGLDVPKASIAVAYASAARKAEVAFWGRIGTRQRDHDTRIRTLTSKATQLVVYEAGPCGSWLSRALSRKPRRCWVVAPSLVPKNAGDRVTTDRRDATQLARRMRSGDLTPVDVPTVEAAASRDLACAREEASRARQAAQPRLKACLRRRDIRYEGRAPWGPAPVRWLAAVVCPTPAQPLVCQAYGRAVAAHDERLQRLETALRAQVQGWRLAPVVQALQAMRGVQCPVAVTLIADLGDLTRFENPRPLMSALGLPPSASSRGERRRCRHRQPRARRCPAAGSSRSHWPHLQHLHHGFDPVSGVGAGPSP
jgi:transposase